MQRDQAKGARLLPVKDCPSTHLGVGRIGTYANTEPNTRRLVKGGPEYLYVLGVTLRQTVLVEVTEK
jgi:hypothetical protein